MTATHSHIYDAVIAAMQPAEELGGPEGLAYVELMSKIASEANERIINFCAAQGEALAPRHEEPQQAVFVLGNDRHNKDHHYTFDQLKHGNSHDADLMEWMEDSSVGDIYDEGGERVERIS